MEFKRISKHQSDLVFQMLKAAAIWLKNRKIDYWQNWHNPPENHKKWILDGIKKNQFYLIYNHFKLIGMVRMQFSDEMFWGVKKDKAGYIHSFTINRELSGRGLGYKVLNEIEKYLKQNHYDYFRLDCGRKVDKLIEYYRNFGFQEVGSRTVGGEDLILLEKKLSTGKK